MKYLLIFLLGVTACGCAIDKVSSAPAGFVTAVGDKLFDQASGGRRIVLRGVNAGGWLVTENWMCPNKVAASETETYESFVQRFGRERADELYEVYRDSWWGEEDFANIRSLGMNVIRLPLGWRELMTAEGEMLEAGFRRIDWFIDRAAHHGLYTILDLHAAPGSQNGRDHSGEVRFAKTFFDEKYLDLTCRLWRTLASRYRDNRWVAAYDLVNEPEGKVGGLSSDPAVEKGIDRLYRSVREIDSDHLIMIGACWDPCHLPPPAKYGWKNVAYEYHFYAWGAEKDSRKILENLEMHRDRERKDGHKVPVYVGEFTFFVDEAWEQCLQLMAEEGWSWSVWTWKNTSPNYNWGLWRGYYHSPETDALKSDDFETVKRKWRAMGKRGVFQRNRRVTDIIRRHIEKYPF